MHEKEILKKLKALINHVDNSYRNYSQIKVADYEQYISSFEKYFSDLKVINPELYTDFIPSSYNSYMSATQNVPPPFLIPISNNIKYLLDLSAEDETIVPKDFKITTEGIFFAGQYFDALIKVSEILKTAVSEIILIDGYVNDQFLDIFTTVKSGVIIRILTKSRSKNPALDLKEASFNKQYNPNGIVLEIKSNEDFHDRFLIIDKKEFYHFGASLKDLGNKGFMFSKIEEPFVKSQLLLEFNSKW